MKRGKGEGKLSAISVILDIAVKYDGRSEGRSFLLASRGRKSDKVRKGQKWLLFFGIVSGIFWLTETRSGEPMTVGVLTVLRDQPEKLFKTCRRLLLNVVAAVCLSPI